MDSTHPHSAAPSRAAAASAHAAAPAPETKRAFFSRRGKAFVPARARASFRGPSTNRSDNARAKSGRRSATRRFATTGVSASGSTSSCVAMTSSSSSSAEASFSLFVKVVVAGFAVVHSVTSATAATPRSASSAASPPSASSFARGTSTSESSCVSPNVAEKECVSSSRATNASIVTVVRELVSRAASPSPSATRSSFAARGAREKAATFSTHASFSPSPTGTSAATPRLTVVPVRRTGTGESSAARLVVVGRRVFVFVGNVFVGKSEERVSSAPSRTRTRAEAAAPPSPTRSYARSPEWSSSCASASASDENALKFSSRVGKLAPRFSRSSSASAAASAAAAISAHGATCAAACATSADGSAHPPNPENKAVARRHALRVASENARRSFSVVSVRRERSSEWRFSTLADETSEKPPEAFFSFRDASSGSSGSSGNPSNGSRRRCATVRSLRSAASIPLNARATFSRCFSSVAAASATALGPAARDGPFVEPFFVFGATFAGATFARANTSITSCASGSCSACVSTPHAPFPEPDSCSVAAICRARVVNQPDSSTKAENPGRFFSSRVSRFSIVARARAEISAAVTRSSAVSAPRVSVCVRSVGRLSLCVRCDDERCS